MDTSPEAICRRLNEALSAGGERKSQSGLARAAGVERQSVKQWLQKGRISRDYVYAAAKYLEINTDWLLTGIGPMRRTAYGVDMNKLTDSISVLMEVALQENCDLRHLSPDRVANIVALAYSHLSEDDGSNATRHALVTVRAALQQEVSAGGQDRPDETRARRRD